MAVFLPGGCGDTACSDSAGPACVLACPEGYYCNFSRQRPGAETDCLQGKCYSKSAPDTIMPDSPWCSRCPYTFVIMKWADSFIDYEGTDDCEWTGIESCPQFCLNYDGSDIGGKAFERFPGTSDCKTSCPDPGKIVYQITCNDSLTEVECARPEYETVCGLVGHGFGTTYQQYIIGQPKQGPIADFICCSASLAKCPKCAGGCVENCDPADPNACFGDPSRCERSSATNGCGVYHICV